MELSKNINLFLKMGSSSSSPSAASLKAEIDLEAEAMRRYNIRVKGYNYLHHGNYCDYLQWCRGMYELDCLPESCRQGPNWTPRYDSWGNQVN